MRRFVFILGLVGLLAAQADPVPQIGVKTPEDLRRDAAIAEFTQKQEKANWFEKFSRIGQEVGVPADVLAAVSFAETRWDHLTWPPGETRSPENGMPRPFGVMSLMDNEFFGHSLIEAAQLIGHTPEELKADPELNIRGAAALLKKLHQENPLPEGTKAGDIESWQTAIQRYCGIPEDYLSYDHVYSCYVYMSQGYDEYGMHWKPHPVNLAPMTAKRNELWKGQNVEPKPLEALTPAQLAAANAPKLLVPEEKATVNTVVSPGEVNSGFHWIIWVLIALVVLMAGVMLTPKKKGNKQ